MSAIQDDDAALAAAAVAVAAVARDALAVAVSELVVLIAFLSLALVLLPFLSSKAAFLVRQSLRNGLAWCSSSICAINSSWFGSR